MFYKNISIDQLKNHTDLSSNSLVYHWIFTPITLTYTYFCYKFVHNQIRRITSLKIIIPYLFLLPHFYNNNVIDNHLLFF